MTSFRAMKVFDFKDGNFYRIACACGSSDCDLTLELEYDPQINHVYLNMYKTLRWSSYYNDGDKWYKNIWYRFKAAFKCLFFGYVEVEESFIISGSEHMNEYIKVLQACQKHVDKREKESLSK